MCLSAVCWEGVSGWLKRWFIGAWCWRNSLIAPQIVSSQMSSLHSTTDNRRKKLTPKTHAYKTQAHMYTDTLPHTKMYLFAYHSTAYPHSWKAPQLLPTNQCSYFWGTEWKCQFGTKLQTWLPWYFWTLLDHTGVVKNTFGATSSILFTAPYKIFSSIHWLIKMWNQTTLHIMSPIYQTPKIYQGVHNVTGWGNLFSLSAFYCQ